MPEPGSNCAPAYAWVFRFLHTVAGNITTAFGKQFPGIKTFVIALLIPILLFPQACVAARYTIHPGSLNKTDSVAYDSLLVAEAVIDQARSENEAGGGLAKRAKDALNALIDAYNVARASWLTYRDALSRGTAVDIYVSRLANDLADLAKAVRSYRGVGGPSDGPSKEAGEASVPPASRTVGPTLIEKETK
jgi:hypothetical protein